MIVYLSGFPFDNKMSKTHERLERILDAPVKHFQYDVTDPVGSMDLMVAKLKKLEEVEEQVFVMGSSLGGFMATVLASKSDMQDVSNHLILFNPSLFPAESLKKYVGKKVTNAAGKIVTFTEEHVKLYEQLDVYAAFKRIGCYGYGAAVYLTDDPILDSERTAEYITSFHSFGVYKKYDLKGHRLDDEKIISIKEHLLGYYEYLTVHGEK